MPHHGQMTERAAAITPNAAAATTLRNHVAGSWDAVDAVGFHRRKKVVTSRW